jgi:hypothetical protein
MPSSGRFPIPDGGRRVLRSALLYRRRRKRGPKSPGRRTKTGQTRGQGPGQPDRDQARLSVMVEQGIFAEAMAANLHALDPKGKTASLTLEHPEKGTMTLALNPRLTIVQNMNRLFERAAKGRRGLAVVAGRRAALSESGGPADPRAGWPARDQASRAARPTGGPSQASPRKTGACPPRLENLFAAFPPTSTRPMTDSRCFAGKTHGPTRTSCARRPHPSTTGSMSRADGFPRHPAP